MVDTKYEIEFIPELNLYRVYIPEFPQQTCAYYDSLLDAIDVWR